MVEFAKESGMLIVKTEEFKDHPKIYYKIIAFLDRETATITQGLSKKFYNKITPQAMLPYHSVPTISKTQVNDYLFTKK